MKNEKDLCCEYIWALMSNDTFSHKPNGIYCANFRQEGMTELWCQVKAFDLNCNSCQTPIGPVIASICALYSTGRSADAEKTLEIRDILSCVFNTFVGGGQLSILQSQPYNPLVCLL